MFRLNRHGGVGYKVLILTLPTMLSLVVATVWLYPRWPKTKASVREKISAVFTTAVREAIQKEMKARSGGENTTAATTPTKVEEDQSPASDEDVNIIAKGTDKGLVFYTGKGEAGCGMKVETSPPGAEVTLNGSIVGITPISLRGACKSSFSIKLYKKDYELVDRTLTYSEAGTIALRLHRKPAAVAPAQKESGLASPFQRGASDLMDGEF